MCGFGMDLLFRVAIFIVVVIALFAMIQWAAGGMLASITGSSYWGLIRILIGAVVAIIVILVLWRFAQCAGVIGRSGELGLPFYG
jgi:hypothetical protein